MTAPFNKQVFKVSTWGNLYRGSKNCIIETFVDDESYQEQLKAEDEKMDAYLTKHYKIDEEYEG